MTEELKDLFLYLNRLKALVNSNLSFCGLLLIDKKRIDDITCCIDTSIPNDFKDYAKKRGLYAVKSYSAYRSLLSLIKKIFLLNNYYIFKKKSAIRLITVIETCIKSDYIKYLNEL